MTRLIGTFLLMLLPTFLLSCTGIETKTDTSPSASAAVRVPTQPTNVAAAGRDSQVTIKWDPPALATSYNLYWNTTGGVTLASNRILNVSMPFTHPDLTNGRTYFYRISALNVSGESDLSAEVRATPLLPFTRILTKLTDPDAEYLEGFGISVAIDGDYAVVGARRSSRLDPNNPIMYTGAAYVFQRIDGIWSAASGTKLMAIDAETDDRFGCAVSINGDYIIVGASQEDGGPDDPIPDTGAAYVFHRTGPNTWDAGTKILGPDPSAGGNFGSAVSISGEYAVVGQVGESRAIVFRRTGTNTWDEGSILAVPILSTETRFGAAVGISGDYVIVGAHGEEGGMDNLLTDAGAAYIFHRTGLNSWEQVSTIKPHDSDMRDNFGYSVAINGDYAAIGAHKKGNGAGAVYIFHRLGENFWDEGPKIVAPDAQEGDYFGAAIGITGNYVIVGARFEDCGWDENANEGSAYVFERIGANTWDEGTKITIPEGDVNDSFGFSVAISGESAIIGALGDDIHVGNEVLEVGAVYLY